MSAKLPTNPNLEQLKKQAKALFRAHQTGEPDACTRIQALFPRLLGASEAEVLSAPFSLRDAQLVLAREYGFESWPKLKQFVEALVKDPHGVLVMRVAHLIREHFEEAAQVVRRMLEEPEKLAILMISLGQENTAEVMKHLSDIEIRKIAQSISELHAVTDQQEDDVLEEFELLLLTQEGISLKRLDYQTIGDQAKSEAIVRRIQAINDRITTLISELSEQAGKTIQTMENEPDNVAILVSILDKEVLSKLGMKKDRVSKIEGTEKERDVMENFERLLVARTYVSRGGVDYARGALEKVMGPSKARMLLGPIVHEMLLDRISVLLSELPEAKIREVIQTMEDGSEKVSILMNALDQEILSRLGKKTDDTSELEGITQKQEDEILEEFEQLLVTRKYILRGGVDFARGALENSMGPRKAQALLERTEPKPFM